MKTPAANERWQKNSAETWEAMQTMRDAINEHIPMPSLESDLLQGPENSVFCAAVAEAVVNTLAALRIENERLRAALEPFASEADMWGDLVPDDHAPLCVEMGHTDGRYYGSAAKYTVGDLRLARAALAQKGGE